MIRRPPRSTQSRSSAASDVYKRQLGENAVTVVGDNADPGTAQRLVDTAQSSWGRLDGALVSVGGPPTGTVMDTPDAAWTSNSAGNTQSADEHGLEAARPGRVGGVHHGAGGRPSHGDEGAVQPTPAALRGVDQALRRARVGVVAHHGDGVLTCLLYTSPS